MRIEPRLPQAQKLQDLCKQLLISMDIVQHAPTLSAAETQSVLPEGCLVQKTVTGRTGNKLVLWTGVGDYRITRRLYKVASRQLGLPLGSDYTLNPRDIDPMVFYGMMPGMVSPFITEEVPAAHELTALLILDGTVVHDGLSLVAVSLSLTESLIIELKNLEMLLLAYAQTAYGHIPIYKII